MSPLKANVEPVYILRAGSFLITAHRKLKFPKPNLVNYCLLFLSMLQVNNFLLISLLAEAVCQVIGTAFRAGRKGSHHLETPEPCVCVWVGEGGCMIVPV